MVSIEDLQEVMRSKDSFFETAEFLERRKSSALDDWKISRFLGEFADNMKGKKSFLE